MCSGLAEEGPGTLWGRPEKTTVYDSKLFLFVKDIAEDEAAQGVKCIKQFTINIELIPEISTREYNRAINPLIH